MNASAPALTREDEVQSKIRKVSAFGRVACVVCAAFFGFGLVGSVSILLFGAFGLAFPGPDNGIGYTPEQKMWALPMYGIVLGIWLAVVFHLYRLFGNLATGAIYTPENVRRVRHVGLLWLSLAVLGVAIPVASTALLATGFDLPKSAPAFSWSESLSSFAAAGLVLLVSWIMDVGLYEKNHADALQRDADLVI